MLRALAALSGLLVSLLMPSNGWASPGDSWDVPPAGWYRSWQETCVAPTMGECVAEAGHGDGKALTGVVDVESGDGGELPGFGGSTTWPVLEKVIDVPIGSVRSRVAMRVEAKVHSVRAGDKFGLIRQFAEFEFSGFLYGQGSSGFHNLRLDPSGTENGVHTVAFELDPCDYPVARPAELHLRALLDASVNLGDFPVPEWGRVALDVEIRLIDAVVTAGEPC